MIKNCFISIVCSVLLFTMGLSRNAFAGAMDNGGIGLKGYPMGGAYTGIADTASAVYYNPAGLVALNDKTVDVEAYGYCVFGTTKYTTPLQTDVSKNEPIIPGVFASYRMDDNAFGFGSYITHAGGGVTYKHFQGTPYDLEAGAALNALTFAFSHKISEHFSVGTGLSAYLGVLEAKLYTGSVIPGVMESEYKDIAGYGASIGLMYNASSKLNIGFMARSETSAEIDGEVRYSGTGTKSDSTVEFTTPVYYRVGIGYRPDSKLKVGVDFCYMLYGDMDKQTIKTDGEPAIEAPTYYKDTYEIGTGLEYKVKEYFSVLGGFRYSPSGSKDEGFSARNPDVDRLHYSIGCSVDLSKSSAVTIVGDFTRGRVKRIGDMTIDQRCFELIVGTNLKF